MARLTISAPILKVYVFGIPEKPNIRHTAIIAIVLIREKNNFSLHMINSRRGGKTGLYQPYYQSPSVPADIASFFTYRLLLCFISRIRTVKALS